MANLFNEAEDSPQLPNERITVNPNYRPSTMESFGDDVSTETYQVYFMVNSQSQFHTASGIKAATKFVSKQFHDPKLTPQGLLDSKAMFNGWYSKKDLNVTNSIVITSPLKSAIGTALEATGGRTLHCHPKLCELSVFGDGQRSLLMEDVTNYIEDLGYHEVAAAFNVEEFAGCAGPVRHDYAIKNMRESRCMEEFNAFWDGLMESEVLNNLVGDRKFIIISGHPNWLLHMAQNVENCPKWDYLAHVRLPPSCVARFWIEVKNGKVQLCEDLAPSVAYKPDDVELEKVNVGHEILSFSRKAKRGSVNGMSRAKSNVASFHQDTLKPFHENTLKPWAQRTGQKISDFHENKVKPLFRRSSQENEEAVQENEEAE